MASFRGHLATAGLLGLGYGGFGFWHLKMDLETGLLGAGLTALGGLLPDLDSDSSVPNRLLFRLAGAAGVFLAARYWLESTFSLGQGLFMVAGAFVLVRYVLAFFFQYLTVHRGMFHSIPGLGIAGLAIFLLEYTDDLERRLFLAGAVMLGYFSHLLLDEICAVDFQGLRVRKPFGSALKFFSSSLLATTFSYFLLFSLAALALLKS